MTIVQITPGAGGMYCGNCFRDNALVAELRKQGHDVTMLPLYLPMTLDEQDQSAGAPIFFSGVNVYLEQKSSLFRHMPGWLHRWFASPKILQWAAGRAAKTRAADVGDLTLSMMRGEDGNQARELDELIVWLKAHNPPDIICLSNALLVGMVRKLKRELVVPVVVTLQGEDTFLDALPPRERDAAWQLLTERARDVDLFIAPSRYYDELMSRRLNLRPNQSRVIYNGINLDGFEIQNPESRIRNPPTLGYFARMCREKGLDLLVDVFIGLRHRNRVPGLKLHVGGGCGPSDEPFVAEQKRRLESAGVLGDVRFFPNVSREEKLAFLRDLTVFSTPALYGEAFGLYVIEALAAGVPVVQPRHGAFSEIIEETGGGLIAEPNVTALADGIESLLLDTARARALGAAGRNAVHERFSIQAMAEQTGTTYTEMLGANR
jgi:glycosyltransferase involved in cell wall biosynthesis